MSLISLLVAVVILGLVLYLVNEVFPMPAWLKLTVNVLAGLFVLVWVLQSFGFTGSLRIR